MWGYVHCQRHRYQKNKSGFSRHHKTCSIFHLLILALHIFVVSDEPCDVFVKRNLQWQRLSLVFKATCSLFSAQTWWGVPPRESAPCCFQCYNIRPQVNFPKHTKVRKLFYILMEDLVFQEHQWRVVKTSLKKRKQLPRDHKKPKRNKSFSLWASVVLFLEVKKHFGNVFGCKITDH